MRKACLTGLTLILGLVFIVAPMSAFAGSSCGLKKSGTTSTTSTSAESKFVGADKACSASKTACASKTGTTTAKADNADAQAKFASASFNVSGMTCGGCESHLTKVLTNTDGINSVDKVCHKSGTAMVTYDASKVSCASKLAKVITDAGYGAEIIPAVATSGDVKASGVNAGIACDPSKCTTALKAGCDPSKCTTADKAACAAKCAAKSGTKEIKAEPKTDGSM